MIIKEIDGKAIRVILTDVLELLPGKHVFKIKVTKERLLTNETVYWNKPLIFDSTYIAGNLYYLRLEKNPDTLDWELIAHNVTAWPEVAFLFGDYIKQRTVKVQ